MRPPRRGRDEPRSGLGTAWRKISGRDELDRAIEQRYQPYGYESNANLARWVTFGMLLWCAVVIGLSISDRAEASMLARWQAQGFTSAPPAGLEPAEIFSFAAAHGLDCTTGEDVIAPTPDCERILGFRAEVASAGDRSAWFALGLVVLLLALAFVFSLFTHRASRNLLPLKAEGQRFTPEWAVACFYIPVINLFRPFQVFVELFAGSGPYRLGDDPGAWKDSMPPAIVGGWWMTVLASLGLNPIVLGFVLADETLREAVSTAGVRAWVDVWLAVPALMAVLVVHALHRRQEARFRAVGPNIVTRPRPEPEF